MRVLHIVSEYFPIQGGYCYRTKSLCDALKKNNTDPVLLIGPHREIKSPKEDFEVIEYNSNQSKRLLNKPFVVLDFAKQIEKICGERKIELIHSHTPEFNGLAAYLAAKRLKIPWIHEVRGLPDESWKLTDPLTGKNFIFYLEYDLERRIVLSLCKNLIYLTNPLKNYFEQKNIICKNSIVISNGVNIDKFTPLEKSNLINHAESKEKIFLYAGRIHKLEGLESAIKAMSIVSLQYKTAKLLIFAGIGKKRYIDELKLLAKTLNLKGKVEFRQSVPNNEMPKYLCNSVAYLLPRSKNIVSELISPLKPFEPMACEIPVIATDTLAFREIIEDNKTGFLFEADNEKELAEKMIFILKNPSKIKIIGKNARKWIENERSWDKVGAKLAHYYKNII